MFGVGLGFSVVLFCKADAWARCVTVLVRFILSEEEILCFLFFHEVCHSRPSLDEMIFEC